MGFSNKQRAFIEEYLHDFNATQAALRAGYSERSAYSIGHENLKKPEIAQAIQQRIEEIKMSADEVLMRLADQARGIPNRYYTDYGDLDMKAIVRDNKTHLIKKITRTQYGRNIEAYDSQAALDKIARALGLYSDNDGSTLNVNIMGLDRMLEKVYDDDRDSSDTGTGTVSDPGA